MNEQAIQNKELLRDFETMCRFHDWYFDFSDDHRHYLAGLESSNRLRELEKQLDEAGLVLERKAIKDKYCPWADAE